MANVQDAILVKVVGEICNMLANVILLAPDDERIVLADFALTQVAPFTTACAETSRRNISPWITAVGRHAPEFRRHARLR